MVQGTAQADVVHAMIGFFKSLRELHDDMTVLQAQALFYAAYQPGITQRELTRLLGAANSTASRTMGVLSEFGNRDTPGLELIRMVVNPEDRRERR